MTEQDIRQQLEKALASEGLLRAAGRRFGKQAARDVLDVTTAIRDALMKLETAPASPFTRGYVTGCLDLVTGFAEARRDIEEDAAKRAELVNAKLAAVLQALADGPRNVTQVTAQLDGRDKSTVSRQLASFREEGWVESRKGDDGRETIYWLTRDGERIVAQLPKVVAEVKAAEPEVAIWKSTEFEAMVEQILRQADVAATGPIFEPSRRKPASKRKQTFAEDSDFGDVDLFTAGILYNGDDSIKLRQREHRN